MTPIMSPYLRGMVAALPIVRGMIFALAGVVIGILVLGIVLELLEP